MLINLEGPPLKSLLRQIGARGATNTDQPRGTTPEVLLYEMGGATDADEPRGTTPKSF